MKKDQLKKILDDIGNAKIAVTGDFCLDAYWFIDEMMGEISVETNLATRPVQQQRYSLGGAGNVTSNLAAMGVRNVCAFGVIGADPFGTEMIRIMKETGIDTRNMLVQEKNWSTHTYAKPYINEKEINRVDFGNYNQFSETTADLLIANLVREIPGFELIVINQQVSSGIHTSYFKKLLREVVLAFPDKIFITDSRNFNDYYDGTIRKMNDTEAARLCGVNKSPDEEVPYAELVGFAKILFERFNRPVFITRGGKGSIISDQDGIAEIPGLLILSRIDTVGAGDSYLAGVAAALAAGYARETAAHIGTFVAGVTIQKLFQTGTATPEEIIQTGCDPDYVYSPDLADNMSQARYIPGTEIEIIHAFHDKRQISHAIFDHDGTISTLREGWELIMTPMMIRSILGKGYRDADKALYRKVQSRVQECIDSTTGHQTLFQMNVLLSLIREFGCVPKDEMLDEVGYKQIYNKELLKLVKERERKLERGELTPEDLTLKNSIPFLMKLRESGIKLYLASGTDTEDVKREAHILGYDHLFEGRIFGAAAHITREAKQIILDQILDTFGETALAHVVTFGDGPVEIRETSKRGGMTIGVASNELRRFGLNEIKRSRLIRAGADIIIPDFCQYPHLLHLFNLDK